MKADKGNQVIIIDKDDYDNRMNESIKEDNFTVCRRSPLNAMVTDARRVIDNLHNVFNVNKYRLRISNPQVPLMYGLPKVHKVGEKMRKIVSGVTSPFAKVSKWIVKEMKQFGLFEGFAVKNVFDFVDKVQNIELEEDISSLST